MNESKLIEMILFFTYDNPLTTLELMDRLSLADFMAFGKLGHSISNVKYMRLELSPCLYLREYAKLFIDMEYLGLLNVDEKDKVVGEAPNLEVFEDDELKICQDVFLNPHTDEWPQKFLGYLDAGIGEVVPYETIYLGKKQTILEDTVDWAVEMVETLE